MMTKHVFTIVGVVVILVTSSETARILAIMPTPSYSHQIVFNPLWKALHSKGHHITLLTTNPIKNSDLSNFRQIDWSFAYDLWHEKHNISDIIHNFSSNWVKCLLQYAHMTEDISIQEFKHLDVQEIISNRNEHFDLVVAEVLNPIMIAFSKRFDCPFIGVCSMDATNFVHEAINSPISPALYPDFVSPFDSDMTFFERAMNIFYSLGSKLYLKYHLYPKMDNIIKQFFGEGVPKLEDMQRNASMIFLNVNPLIHNIRPLMSNVLTLGGGTHFKNGASLTPDIKEFLDNADTGVIYFSLGTNVNSRNLSNKNKAILLEVFSELPYKILWKFDDKISTKSNIMIRNWLPQQQILKHPNTKLFITQGGLQSVEEAIFYGIPIIGMPAYVDQYSNVRKIVRRGIGLQLDHNNLEKHTFMNSINEVIINPKYKSMVLKLSKLLADRPISGIDEAVWWTEYILKHKGAKFLKHKGIPLFQYLLIDILAFLLLFVTMLTLLMYLFLSFIIHFVKIRRRSKGVKLE